MTDRKAYVAAPLGATALIAQQVGGNAIRDGLFLSLFEVQTLPYFVGGAAVLAIAGALLSGRLLTRVGPARAAPLLIAASAASYLVEWLLLGSYPRAAAVLLYLHSTVIGAIAISAFWSLLNERFDPHSAKPLMARVAGAASLGGFTGGVGAERVAALLPEGALLPLLAAVGACCVVCVLIVGKGASGRRPQPADTGDADGAWVQLQRLPLLRHLALLIALASGLGALTDYVLKAEAVAFFGRGPQLVRFFGLFYSATSLIAGLVQVSVGRLALGRLGLGGSVAAHPAMVAAAALLGFVLPSPWRGMLPRGCDFVMRNSTFRVGYELLYTPVAESAKRSVKSLIDVAFDCAGRAGAALVILLLAQLAPSSAFAAVNLAAATVAAGEFLVSRRLREGYVSALEGGLRRQGDSVEQMVEWSMADFTVAGSMAGLDRAAVMRALGTVPAARPADVTADPVIAAIVELRSGDLLRIRAALRDLPRDPLVIGALVPLLARDGLVQPAVAALAGFGARAAGELVAVLLDPAASVVVRRRVPLALKSCPSPVARDGLRAGLSAAPLEVRLRCSRALLALAETHPELQDAFPAALALAEEALAAGGEAPLVREHVFNLLALVLEREPVQIAARAFASGDAYVRGTALEYLETVLTPRLFAAFRPLLTAAGAAPGRRPKSADAARADLLRAGTTMTVSLDELRRQLDIAAHEDA